MATENPADMRLPGQTAYGFVKPVRPAAGQAAPLWDLTKFLDEAGGALTGDFGVRLERTVAELTALDPGEGVEAERLKIAETLHEGVLRDLRVILGKVLAEKRRVAVLVDNLDKTWDKSSDVAELSAFLFGLLSSVNRITREFSKRDHWRKAVPVTLAVFVRSDVFDRVLEQAREPDKIPHTKISWDDPDLLMRVVEERYVAARGGKAPPDDLWKKFFCPTIDGVTTREYLLGRTLPRPRDIVLICNAAIMSAANRGHTRVEEEDVREAEQTYSQFAFEALLVENGLALDALESVLYEFVGFPATLEQDAVTTIVTRAGTQERDVQSVIDHLRSRTFLGVETRPGEFDFSEDEAGKRKADVLARRLAETQGADARFCVHPAFRPFLEIEN